MLPIRILPPLLSLALPAFSAIDLALHPGSTRDWVKWSGSPGDSARYHLEFLDSTRRDSSSEEGDRRKADTTIDWRVRITSPDSPTVADTAILRVLRSRWVKRHDSLHDEEERRIRGIAYWLMPSKHFPIDLQAHSEKETSLEGINMDNYLANGAWEALLLNYWSGNNSTLTTRQVDYTCSSKEGNQFCFSTPTIASRDSLGIVAWLGSDAFWELRGVDGTVRPPCRGGLGHPLRKWESWTYKSTRSKTDTGVTDVWTVHVTLALLDPPRDTSGMLLLKLLELTRLDGGAASIDTLFIQLDPLKYFVQMRTGDSANWRRDSGTPWQRPWTEEGLWALSLMRHLVLPDSTTGSYGDYRSRGSYSSFPSSVYSNQDQTKFDNAIGATEILTSAEWDRTYSSTGPIMDKGYVFSWSWTLVAHSFENAPPVGTSPKASPLHRDLAWLRARIAQDPSLEVVRIGLDGTRSVARGAAVSKLLERRGMGIVQVQDGQELVTLRVVRP